jgi:NADH:ubiquinone reductase (non-electrogenic)
VQACPLKTTLCVSLVTQKDLYPGTQLDQDPKKKTVVVLGNGWGATSFLKNLDNDEYNVIVISPRNYFLFTPLLPSVTVGTLEARSVIQPTRFITRHKKRKVAVYEAEATNVDPVNKTVTIEGEFQTHHRINMRMLAAS